jgi:hypothetical protein
MRPSMAALGSSSGGRGGHLATPTPMAGRIRPRESDPRSPTSGAPVAGSHLLFARHAMELREARAEGAWPQFPMPRRPPSPGHTSAKPAAAAQGFTDPAARGPDPAEERRIPPPVNTSNPSPPTIFQREKGDAGRQQSPAAAVLAFCRFAGFWLRRRPGVWAVGRARGLRCASLTDSFRSPTSGSHLLSHLDSAMVAHLVLQTLVARVNYTVLIVRLLQ